jgi:predicted GNAT superfamily acetyltransferase
MSEITIRNIDDAAEMRAVEDLQKEVWGIPDLDVVPLSQLVAAKEAGGILIGAFAGPTLVGFVYGFPAFEDDQLAHHSHMLAVKPAYRKFDLGRRLKLGTARMCDCPGNQADDLDFRSLTKSQRIFKLH